MRIDERRGRPPDDPGSVATDPDALLLLLLALEEGLSHGLPVLRRDEDLPEELVAARGGVLDAAHPAELVVEAGDAALGIDDQEDRGCVVDEEYFA